MLKIYIGPWHSQREICITDKKWKRVRRGARVGRARSSTIPFARFPCETFIQLSCFQDKSDGLHSTVRRYVNANDDKLVSTRTRRWIDHLITDYSVMK